MLNPFGTPDDPYAAGWEKGYLDALSDVAAETHRLGDLGTRQRVQKLIVSLTTQMRYLVDGATR